MQGSFAPLLKKRKEKTNSQSEWVSVTTRGTHTLITIMRTELKAVCHTLNNHFLRVQVRKPEKEVEVHQVQRGHQN